MKLTLIRIIYLCLALSAFTVHSVGAAEISDVMPYDSHYIKILDATMHYVEGGKSGGQVFLFLHGNPGVTRPTWLSLRKPRSVLRLNPRFR